MGKNVRCRCKGLNRSIFFLMGMFLSFSLWAQTGVICGTVTDAKLKEPLIGASVVIEGTTVGAITDIDGNFRIENVRPGTYTVTASYVSYQTQTVRDVPVVAQPAARHRTERTDSVSSFFMGVSSLVRYLYFIKTGPENSKFFLFSAGRLKLL